MTNHPIAEQDSLELLIARLRRKSQQTPGMGSTTVSRDENGGLKVEQKIWDDGMRLVNPDGPEAADTLSQMRDALDDAVATIAAVRATAASPGWADTGDHFYALCGETLQRIATTTKIEKE